MEPNEYGQISIKVKRSISATFRSAFRGVESGCEVVIGDVDGRKPVVTVFANPFAAGARKFFADTHDRFVRTVVNEGKATLSIRPMARSMRAVVPAAAKEMQMWRTGVDPEVAAAEAVCGSIDVVGDSSGMDVIEYLATVNDPDEIGIDILERAVADDSKDTILNGISTGRWRGHVRHNSTLWYHAIPANTSNTETDPSDIAVFVDSEPIETPTYDRIQNVVATWLQLRSGRTGV